MNVCIKFRDTYLKKGLHEGEEGVKINGSESKVKGLMEI